jgi:twitching motility two-component system response regulator PilH
LRVTRFSKRLRRTRPCEWVKSNPETKDIIIFLFTALNQEHDYREGQRIGCDLYLTKPQNPKDIVEKVREYLQSKSSQTDHAD